MSAKLNTQLSSAHYRATQNAKCNLFFLYGGQLLQPYYEAEPSTGNDKQNNSAEVSLLSVIKTGGNNLLFLFKILEYLFQPL